MWIERSRLAGNELEGQVVVVTGAGQGIGREAALALSRLGASVALAEVRDIGADTERLIQIAGGKALFVRTDVANPTDVARLKRRVERTLGPVDVLVNSAAHAPVGPLLDESLEEWERTFAVNLRAVYLCVRAFVPSMLRRHRGVVVSMDANLDAPFLAPYLASKAGLRSIARELAMELGSAAGVSVLCFDAGLVATPGQKRMMREIARIEGKTEEAVLARARPGTGILSPELCAAALAGVIVSAREYHGEEASYVDGLARIGLPWAAAERDEEPQDERRTAAFPAPIP